MIGILELMRTQFIFGSIGVHILYMNLPPLPFFLILLPPIPGVISTGIIFSFTYMCTHKSTIFIVQEIPQGFLKFMISKI
jgi:hypothetical protein